MSTICVIKSRKYPIEEEDIVDGGTLNAQIIVKELIKKGFNIEVFTRYEGNGRKMFNKPGIRIFRVPFIRSKKRNVLQRDYEEGCSFIKSVVSHSEFQPEKYICIHTHHWTSGVGLESFIPKQLKLIHTPHLLAIEKAYYNKLSFSSCIKACEQALINRANHVIALSKSEKEALIVKYGCNKEKIILAPNGVDSVFFKIPLPKKENINTLPLLFIGRRCRQKGSDILLEAVKQISKKDIPISLRLVGGSYGEANFDKLIESRIQKLLSSCVIKQFEEVSHNLIPSLIKDSLIYVQPSRYESQGVAILEAMAAGRIVIASNLPAISEYICHGKNGFLVDSENSNALAKSIMELLINPEKSILLARAARETAKNYTWSHMLKSILPLFESNQI